MTNYPELAFYSCPFAQLLVNPYEDKVRAANNKACQLLEQDFPSIRENRASDLFSDFLPQWILFTEEAFTSGFAWRDKLTIFTNEGLGIEVEASAKTTSIEEVSHLVITIQTLEDLIYQREKSEANKHYNSGIQHWDRIAKIFREFERENHLILDAAGEGIYGVNNEGETTFVNKAAERILGWSRAELIGKNIHKVIHHSHKNGEHFCSKNCSIYQAFKDGIKRTVDDEVFWTRSGKAIEVEYTSTPIEENGYLVGAVVVFRDVTQKRLDQKRLIDALKEVEELKTRLEMENAYLQEEINSEFNHHQIVGKSPAIQKIIQQIEMVAPANATVLIIGESGTGKELIARAIHELSERRNRSLIRVNCAAIPAELFESEFFGHIKGAFTGATESRVGRFELADGGTLFLDEVGEIPLNLQGKLLRVLQEQQFERVGDSKTRGVNVRIIAATNQNLKQRVKDGLFREDLYFRLNVFPIESVPLRQRIEDIPLLAQHFLQKESKNNSRSSLKIPLLELEKLKQYSWPGNIRELENVIERQVILAKNGIVNFSTLPQDISSNLDTIEKTHTEFLTEEELKQRDRTNIVSVLKKTKGKVSGKNGAAEVLNIKPTTLSSRIKKLGIDVQAFK